MHRGASHESPKASRAYADEMGVGEEERRPSAKPCNLLAILFPLLAICVQPRS
jgi:hypothetical protein